MVEKWSHGALYLPDGEMTHGSLYFPDRKVVSDPTELCTCLMEKGFHKISVLA
jgi:hypothetical protein